MAKTSLERTIERQQRAAKRQAQENARQQQAITIVNGQPSINGLRIMDAAAEEVLYAILGKYEENESRSFLVDFSDIPEAYHSSMSLEIDKLKVYGMITNACVSIDGTTRGILSPQALSYFHDKDNALQKESDSQQVVQHKDSKEYDVFISHANKDKSTYVDELYMALRKLGIKIFYDSEVLSWGDNWKQVILDGTERSEFAIIVISENFFDREWTERELSEFLRRQNENGQKVVLPLLHGITIEQLKIKYPVLGDIQVIDTARFDKETITIMFAKELIKRLR